MGDNQHPDSHPGASWELMEFVEQLCYITIIRNSKLSMPLHSGPAAVSECSSWPALWRMHSSNQMGGDQVTKGTWQIPFRNEQNWYTCWTYAKCFPHFVQLRQSNSNLIHLESSSIVFFCSWHKKEDNLLKWLSRFYISFSLNLFFGCLFSGFSCQSFVFQRLPLNKL